MVTSTRLLALLRHIGRLDSHVRQTVALLIAVVSFLFFIEHGRSPITRFIAIWNIYAIVVLLMAWVTICTANPRTILFMAALAVIQSWLLIHTVFTLRYAHVFYRSEQEADVEGSGGGLIFPGGHYPDYQDFAYFSFVVGMTCQVSDVNITSRSMRRLALLHGLLSFAFNTVILALSINIISGLLVN